MIQLARQALAEGCNIFLPQGELFFLFRIRQAIRARFSRKKIDPVNLFLIQNSLPLLRIILPFYR